MRRTADASSSSPGSRPAKQARSDAPAQSTLRPASINDLPTDLLVLLFAFFPVRARMLAAAPVCRRWRAAAFRSITSVDLACINVAGFLPLPACLAHFPNLTELTFDDSITNNACRIPSTLRSLTIRYKAPANDGPLPALTALNALVKSNPSAFIPLLRQSVSSLASLEMHLPDDRAAVDELAAYLAATHFPALTRLAYDQPAATDAACVV